MSPEDVIKHLGYPDPDDAPAWVKALAELTSDARGHAEALRGREPQVYTASDEDWLAMAKKTHDAVLLKDGWTRTQKALLRRMDECLAGRIGTAESQDGSLWVDDLTLTPSKATKAAAAQLVRLGVLETREWRTSVFDGQRLVAVVYRPLRSIFIEDDKRKPSKRRD